MSNDLYNIGERLQKENQRFFINSGEVFGVQSINASYQAGVQPLIYLGVSKINLAPQGAQINNVGISTLLISDDKFIDLTGNSGINGYIVQGNNKTDKNFSFTSGYLTNYHSKCAIGEIPQIDANFVIFGNVGRLTSGESVELSGHLKNINNSTPNTSFTQKIASYGAINLGIDNFNTDRVLSYDLNIGVARNPLYVLGSKTPIDVQINYPLEVTCAFQVDVDNYTPGQLYNGIFNTGLKNVSINLRNYSGLENLASYNFSGMYISEESNISNINGNVQANVVFKKHVLRPGSTGYTLNLNANSGRQPPSEPSVSSVTYPRYIPTTSGDYIEYWNGTGWATLSGACLSGTCNCETGYLWSGDYRCWPGCRADSDYFNFISGTGELGFYASGTGLGITAFFRICNCPNLYDYTLDWVYPNSDDYYQDMSLNRSNFTSSQTYNSKPDYHFYLRISISGGRTVKAIRLWTTDYIGNLLDENDVDVWDTRNPSYKLLNIYTGMMIDAIQGSRVIFSSNSRCTCRYLDNMNISGNGDLVLDLYAPFEKNDVRDEDGSLCPGAGSENFPTAPLGNASYTNGGNVVLPRQWEDYNGYKVDVLLDNDKVLSAGSSEDVWYMGAECTTITEPPVLPPPDLPKFKYSGISGQVYDIDFFAKTFPVIIGRFTGYDKISSYNSNSDKIRGILKLGIDGTIDTNFKPSNSFDWNYDKNWYVTDGNNSISFPFTRTGYGVPSQIKIIKTGIYVGASQSYMINVPIASDLNTKQFNNGFSGMKFNGTETGPVIKINPLGIRMTEFSCPQIVEGRESLIAFDVNINDIMSLIKIPEVLDYTPYNDHNSFLIKCSNNKGVLGSYISATTESSNNFADVKWANINRLIACGPFKEITSITSSSSPLNCSGYKLNGIKMDFTEFYSTHGAWEINSSSMTEIVGNSLLYKKWPWSNPDVCAEEKNIDNGGIFGSFVLKSNNNYAYPDESSFTETFSSHGLETYVASHVALGPYLNTYLVGAKSPNLNKGRINLSLNSTNATCFECDTVISSSDQYYKNKGLYFFGNNISWDLHSNNSFQTYDPNFCPTTPENASLHGFHCNGVYCSEDCGIRIFDVSRINNRWRRDLNFVGIYVGGNFDTFKGTTTPTNQPYSIYKFKPDGTMDARFVPPTFYFDINGGDAVTDTANARVFCAKLTPNQRFILVGGQFTAVKKGSTTIYAKNLVMLNSINGDPVTEGDIIG